MGIKFYCPQGHRIHVKAFLAGKAAKCPKCNAKVRIPQIGETPAAFSSPSQSPESAEREAEPANHGELTESPLKTVPAGRYTSEPRWYVQHPEKGQLGPIRTSILEQWIQEGRVTSHSWLWTDGWPDWKLASQHFQFPDPAVPKLFTNVQNVTRTRRQRRDFSITAITVLSLASLVLLILLILVSRRT